MVRYAGLAEESRVFLLYWPYTSFPKASLHFLTSSPLRAGPSVYSLQAAPGMFFKMSMESFPLPTLFSHLLLFRRRSKPAFESLCGQAHQTPRFPLASSHVMKQAVLACDPGPCMCCSYMPEPSPFHLAHCPQVWPPSILVNTADHCSLPPFLESYLQVVGAWIKACLLPWTVKEHVLCWWIASAQHNACPTTGAQVFIGLVSLGGRGVSLHC